jgi:uncharacterized membrane protein HdeD (DUF308 family)
MKRGILLILLALAAFYSPHFDARIPDVAGLIGGIVLVLAGVIEFVVYVGSRNRIT